MNQPKEIYGKPWSEREFIIVLNLYISNRDHLPSIGSLAVNEVSRLLGRTPASIVMRMENFASIDPLRTTNRVGLQNMYGRGRNIFNRWHQHPETLKECAAMLVREQEEKLVPNLFEPNPVRMPKAFDQYELMDLLGEGAFGSVYSCINDDPSVTYALKIIRTDKLSNEEVVARFRREMKALRTISHPNIIKIFADNLDDTPNFPGFVMQFARCSLTDRIREWQHLMPGTASFRHPLPFEEAVDIIRSVTGAVSALHNHVTPVVHRDLKPDNILHLLDGKWVLADFSLSKFIDPNDSTSSYSTLSKQAWGSDHYSAPEQFRDFRSADQRADIFSLGVLTWHLFSTEWPTIQRDKTGLPRLLTALVLKATDRLPEDRHQTIVEFTSDLDEALREARESCNKQ